VLAPVGGIGCGSGYDIGCGSGDVVGCIGNWLVGQGLCVVCVGPWVFCTRARRDGNGKLV